MADRKMHFRRGWVLAGMAVAGLCLGAGCTGGNRPLERPAGVEMYVEGALAYKDGNKTEAEEKLRSAIDQNPQLTMARDKLGDLYRESGEYEKASEQYEVTTRLDPYYYLNYYKLGVTYQFLERLQDAAANYVKAITLNPRDASSNMNLGLVHLSTGRIDDAITYLQRATELNPQSPDVWLNYGVALDARRDYPRAEAAYRKSLELDTTRSTTLLNLGSNLILQNRPAEAITVLQEAVKRSDTPVIRKRLGDAFAAAARYDEALVEYEVALKLNPNFYPAMNEMGSIYIVQYKKGLELDETLRSKALAMWRKSLAVNPSQPRVVGWLRQWDEDKMFGRE
jgi:tetratricopeptide (TPR) repeat protein